MEAGFSPASAGLKVRRYNTSIRLPAISREDCSGTATRRGDWSAETLGRVYTHVIDGAKRVAAQQVGGELFKTVHDAEGTRTLTH